MRAKTLKFKRCDLKKMTWLKSGGEAELFKPESIEELSQFIKTKRDFITIGAGSNILAGDNIRKTVLRLGRQFNYVRYLEQPDRKRIIAGGATLGTAVSKFAMENGISGFEFLSAIPGTIGGAVKMNAGAYGDDTSKILMRVTLINEYGELLELPTYNLGFRYRGSAIPANWVVVETGFKVSHEDPEVIREKMARMLRQKQSSQPAKSKTCGSIFKNPTGIHAWELIERAGFRGFKLGDAEISTKHCNFLINNGDASYEDLVRICHIVRDGVEEKCGIKLEFELVFI